MTVRELIEKLQMEDPEAVVFYTPGGGQYVTPTSLLKGFTTDSAGWFFYNSSEEHNRPAVSIDDFAY